MRGRDEHLYHPRWKGYLMVLIGGLNVGNTVVCYHHGLVRGILFGMFLCLWCFGMGFWWLWLGYKDNKDNG